MSDTARTLDVAGMIGEGRVRIDRWGVAHVDASTAHDAYLLQGYLAARNRLFQIDLWRRRGLGLVAEALGEEYVERDIAARHFLYRGDMDVEWASYGEGARDAVQAFVAGINAFIQAAHDGAETMPPEFGMLGYSPAEWKVDDVVRIRLHGLYDNARSEVARARTLRDHGSDVDDLRRIREPWRPVELVDDDVLDRFFDGALDLYELAMAPIDVESAPVPATPPASVDGSNSWVVAGSRTSTGRPLLANDPHRAMSNPSLRMLVHLRCPEFDVIGAGEPMLPGVSLGHNGRVAFGLTIFPTDQEDVYLYELADERSYRFEGGVREVEIVDELVPVRGGRTAEARLRFTVHGPITGTSDDGRHAAATRVAWLEPGMAPYLGSLRYQRATDADQFRAALAHWGAPTVNQVFADDAGRVRWQACGRVPRRSWDGLTPVPGDGRFEWTGYRPLSDFPSALDPAEGWVATANQFCRADEVEPLSFEWLAPFRHQRIAEVLRANAEVTVADSIALQLDVMSLPARSVIARLTGVRDQLDAKPTRTGLLPRLTALLCEWDLRATPDSPAAGVFETWFRGPLRRRLIEERVADLGGDAAMAAAIDPAQAEELTGDPRLDLLVLDDLAQEEERLIAVLADSLEAAADELMRRWGADIDDWTLSRVQRTRFRHPAGARAEAGWDLETVRGGTPDTVNVFARNAAGDQTVGASVRLVIDVGAWDESRAVNSPGQSGVPGDRHYGDLVGLWASGGTFPLAYSEAAVAAVSEEEIRFSPTGEIGAEHEQEGVVTA